LLVVGPNGYIWDLWINEYYNSSVLTNLNVTINGSSIYSNASVFNGTAYLDLTTGGFIDQYLNTQTPLPLTFTSDTQGILQYSNLSISYNNSLNLLVYDENTGALITDNITIVISNEEEENTYWTTTGHLNIGGHFNGNYIIKGYGSEYPSRYYYVDFSGDETINMSIFLSKNATSEVTFTIRNQLTFDVIEGAEVSMERVVNGSWQFVGSKLSDITGKVQLSYIPETRYRFTAEHSSYNTKTWILDPIVDATYNVLLLPSGQQGAQNDYYGVELEIIPERFINNTWNNVSIIISSPGETFASYNISIVYPTGSTSQAGSSSTGETFQFQFNISSTDINDTVIIQFKYTNLLGVSRTYRYPFLIDSPEAGTLASMRELNKSLGLLERVLLMIFLSFLVGGAVMAVGGTEAGLGVALLIQGVMAYLLAINILFIFPTMLAGILLLSRRTQ